MPTSQPIQWHDSNRASNPAGKQVSSVAGFRKSLLTSHSKKGRKEVQLVHFSFILCIIRYYQQVTDIFSMLSRLAFRNVQLLSVAVRGAQTVSSVAIEPTRPKRLIDPSPVRHGFIPEEWFQAFYSKTGASGPYVFAISVGTYLVSKEIYVLEHEFYNGISLLIICVASVKLFGQKLAQILDKSVDKYHNELNETRDDEITQYEDVIVHEKKVQSTLDGQKMIMDIKKENIKMQLEATYRERMVQIYQEVKKRLDYQVQIQNLERRIAQKHMVQWIVNGVLKSITPEQEKATLHQCIKDLEVLAAKV